MIDNRLIIYRFDVVDVVVVVLDGLFWLFLVRFSAAVVDADVVARRGRYARGCVVMIYFMLCDG